MHSFSSYWQRCLSVSWVKLTNTLLPSVQINKMFGHPLSGILLYITRPPVCGPGGGLRCYLLLSCSWWEPERRQTCPPLSDLPPCSQLLSTAAHLGPREVVGENKPCSKAKLAKKTTLKDSAQ